MPSFVDEIFQPSIEHVADEQISREIRADLNEPGDTSGPGSEV